MNAMLTLSVLDPGLSKIPSASGRGDMRCVTVSWQCLEYFKLKGTNISPGACCRVIDSSVVVSKGEWW